MLRKTFEKFCVNIYLILPAIVVGLYFYLNRKDYIHIDPKYNFELSIALFGVMFTVLGLYGSLPDSRFKDLLKKYKHNKIVYHSLFIGIVCSMFIVIFVITDFSVKIQNLLLLIAITETLISSYWIYRIYYLISQKSN